MTEKHNDHTSGEATADITSAFRATSPTRTLRPRRAHKAQVPGSTSYRAGQHCLWSSAARTRDRGSCWISRLRPPAEPHQRHLLR